MVRKIVAALVFVVYITSLYAQKPALDHTTQQNWPLLAPEIISNDGNYLLYKQGNRNLGYDYIVRSLKSEWTSQLHRLHGALFSEDSRYLFFQKGADTLAIMELKNGSTRFISDVVSYKISSSTSSKFVAYKTKSNDLVIVNLFANFSRTLKSVDEFDFNGNCTSAFYRSKNRMYLRNLTTNKEQIIGTAAALDSWVFDKSGTKLGLIVDRYVTGKVVKQLLYYYTGLDSAEVILDNTSKDMDDLMLTENQILFSDEGDKLFFYVSLKPSNKIKIKADVNIWNYKDDMLQSEQALRNNWGERSFLSVINLDIKKRPIVRLQTKDDDLMNLSENNNCEYAIAEQYVKGFVRARTGEPMDIYLVSTKDGSRTLIEKSMQSALGPKLSKYNKYITWWDHNLGQWYLYSIANKQVICLTDKLDVPIFSETNGILNFLATSSPNLKWLENDKAVLICDRRDIWRIDPQQKIKPVNLTNQYGRNNNVRFDFTRIGKDDFKENGPLVVSAFDMNNKNSGFFSIRLDKVEPRKLCMGPYAYYFYESGSLAESDGKTAPLKAKNADAFVLHRMNSDTYPNLLFTTNFKDFKKVTDLEPEVNYNWYKSELIRYIMPDQKIGEAILYKPENFDSTKKYPVIFYYYEKSSGSLNVYLHPELSRGLLTIPWYVSNGYIVCVPDIYYKSGYPGESAYESVISAANFLKKNYWVDSTKLGLQGHSYGGFETDYIVTRTNAFAAAAPSAAPSELISSYGGLLNGQSGHNFYEYHQGRIGATLWQRPDLYIANSSIFKADKVTTPLLIFHGPKDSTVPFLTQGVPWYIALQSLGKKVWMLDYDGEGHNIMSPQNQLDYSIRLSQFFDHYLKGKPAPIWMTKGVPASLKGLENGYALDPGVDP